MTAIRMAMGRQFVVELAVVFGLWLGTSLWIARGLPLGPAVALAVFPLGAAALLLLLLLAMPIPTHSSSADGSGVPGAGQRRSARAHLVPSRLALISTVTFVWMILYVTASDGLPAAIGPTTGAVVTTLVFMVGPLIVWPLFVIPPRLAAPESNRVRFQTLEALTYYAVAGLTALLLAKRAIDWGTADTAATVGVLALVLGLELTRRS
ncbi:MAG: hypothetical protein U1E29_05625, partial [Coriobacteriia bacterium]|nr:hypothetical protein [Coriobacteriia bacterium]